MHSFVEVPSVARPRVVGRRVRAARIGNLIMLACAAGALCAAASRAEPPEIILSGTHLIGGQSLMSVDPATGAETLIATVTEAGGGLPVISAGALAYDPALDRLYAVGYDAASTSNLWRVDPSTGVLTLIGPTGTGHNLSTGGLTYDPAAGTLFGCGTETASSVQGTFLYAVDAQTGFATVIGHTGTPGTYLHSLGCDPVSGILYALGYRAFNNRSALFTVDKATGAAAFVGENGVEVGRGLIYSDLAFHPQTNVLYVTGSTSASRSGLYTVDTATGAATLVGEFGVGTGATDGGLAFVGSGSTSGVRVGGAGLRLHQNSPNPFNPCTVLRFELDRALPVRLAIHDLAGRRIRGLIDTGMSVGGHEVVWDGKDGAGREMGSGIYLAILTTGREQAAIRMTLVR